LNFGSPLLKEGVRHPGLLESISLPLCLCGKASFLTFVLLSHLTYGRTRAADSTGPLAGESFGLGHNQWAGTQLQPAGVCCQKPGMNMLL
jgi:hypothetical protein